MNVTTDIVYSQVINQLELKQDHMSWLPQEKLSTEEKEVIQEHNKRSEI